MIDILLEGRGWSDSRQSLVCVDAVTDNGCCTQVTRNKALC